MQKLNVDDLKKYEIIPGVPGYMVSKDGSVICVRGNRLSLVKESKGRVILQPIDHPKHGYRVDDLVARAYIIEYRPGDRIIHIDGDKSNNKLNNLRIESMYDPDECWTQIKGYERLYEISSKGRVRSVTRISEYKRGDKVVKRLLESKLMSPWKGHYSRVYILTKDKQSKLYTLKNLMRDNWDEEVLLNWMSTPLYKNLPDLVGSDSER